MSVLLASKVGGVNLGHWAKKLWAQVPLTLPEQVHHLRLDLHSVGLPCGCQRADYQSCHLRCCLLKQDLGSGYPGGGSWRCPAAFNLTQGSGQGPLWGANWSLGQVAHALCSGLCGDWQGLSAQPLFFSHCTWDSNNSSSRRHGWSGTVVKRNKGLGGWWSEDGWG